MYVCMSAWNIALLTSAYSPQHIKYKTALYVFLQTVANSVYDREMFEWITFCLIKQETLPPQTDRTTRCQSKSCQLLKQVVQQIFHNKWS